MIKMAKSHVPVAADTHAGMTGKNNEDNFLVSAYKIAKRTVRVSYVQFSVMVLADIMQAKSPLKLESTQSQM